jgi:hypothetical protein
VMIHTAWGNRREWRRARHRAIDLISWSWVVAAPGACWPRACLKTPRSACSCSKPAKVRRAPPPLAPPARNHRHNQRSSVCAHTEETFEKSIAVPIAAIQLQKTPVDWAFQSEAHHATDGRVHVWPRGKVCVEGTLLRHGHFVKPGTHRSRLALMCTYSMGGCSSLNWMLYVRGNPGGTRLLPRPPTTTTTTLLNKTKQTTTCGPTSLAAPGGRTRRCCPTSASPSTGSCFVLHISCGARQEEEDSCGSANWLQSHRAVAHGGHQRREVSGSRWTPRSERCPGAQHHHQVRPRRYVTQWRHS